MTNGDRPIEVGHGAVLRRDEERAGNLSHRLEDPLVVHAQGGGGVDEPVIHERFLPGPPSVAGPEWLLPTPRLGEGAAASSACWSRSS